MKFKPTPTASAITLALLSMTGTTYAADTGKDVQSVESITVTGIKASKQKSLVAKKNADTVVEVVSAEDIGKMPDKNVADSLQRVPGVNTATSGALEGGFGENDRISLRGTPPSLTFTTINGHVVGSGDWYTKNIGGASRSVSFGLLPSELVDRVTVYKSSRADLVEGGASGSVDIQTRHPLDAKQQISGLVSVEAAYTQLAAKTDPQLSGYFNWKNDTNTFGLMLQAFSEKRHLRRDGQEGVWWDKVDPASAMGKAYPALAGKDISLLTGAVYFEQERKRDGGLVSAQFRPSNDINLEVTAFNSKLKAANSNQNHMQNMIPAYGAGATVLPVGTPGVTGNYISSIAFQNVGWVHDTYARPNAYAESNFVDVVGKFRINESLSISAQAGTTKGTGSSDDIGIEAIGGGGAGSYKFNGMNPANVSLTNSAVYKVADLGGFNTDPNNATSTSEDKERYAQVDATWRLDGGPFESIKAGLRTSKHERSNSVIALLPNPKFATDREHYQTGAIPTPGGDMYPGNWGNSLGGSFSPSFTFTTANLQAWAAKYLVTGDHIKSKEFNIDEPVTAGYVMGSFSGQGFSGNVGVRLVNSEENVSNYQADPKTSQYVAKSFSNTYRDTLPSFNLKMDVATDVIARLGAAKTMSRPDFGSLASFQIDQLNQQASGGDPNLKPIRSNNYEGSLEWYFAPQSRVTAGLYYMDLTTYVGFASSKANFPGYNGVFTFSGPVNTTGKVKGFELSYEQPLGNGFGVNANYTSADGKETSDKCGQAERAGTSHACDLFGTSKDSYNVGAFYEGYGFSAHIAYNYRSAYYMGMAGNDRVNSDAVGSLMASLGYTINNNLSVNFDAKDINDPLLRTYVYDAKGERRPNSFYKNGAQYYLGLRYKF
ncbi:TonB-dependent receptor [Burkholderiaceae bacterium DAT-1]|nr:TonB-dependent receptor [Burkholderiaceae bacterium DAT-1]